MEEESICLARLRSPASLRARAKALGATEWLIEGILKIRNVAILLGNSGLGKSPLMYQAGICVAVGIPFLGFNTRKGRVLIADFENGIADMSETVDRIQAHLGVSDCSTENLRFWSPNDPDEHQEFNQSPLFEILREYKPDLVIIDSLGSYDPSAEEKNSSATLMIRELRKFARDYGTSTILVHHLRKPSRRREESAGPLEDAKLHEWFQDARGASALINGADVRLGVAEPNIRTSEKEGVALVVRGFSRIRGEMGPFYLSRRTDDDENPIGYDLLTGAQLLFNPEQESALAKLPKNFSFKEAKQAYDRKDQATTNWLRRCIALRLVTKISRGQYKKVEESSDRGVNGEFV